MSTIKIVRGDTRPTIIASLTDKATGLPVDLTGATVKMYLRQVGQTTLKDTLTGTLLLGKREDDGSIDTDPPYNIAGAGGRVQFQPGATTFNTAGRFEGEFEVTFSDGGISTTYDKQKFLVRDDLD